MLGKRNLNFATRLTSGALFLFAAASLLVPSWTGAAERMAYVAVGEVARPPIGWAQFCASYISECDTKPSEPRDIVLNEEAWKDLVRVNKWVNDNIKPMTDMDHYGMIQWWRYPDDGAGACHSYALLKRRILIQAGWPREALLMTVVREPNGDGHAVLTVRTDKGEFILDNLNENILLWSETSYRYVKRQSQADPNVWMWLGDARVGTATTSRAH
jgi:predicted transglutaminase-like cysteine proteinase